MAVSASGKQKARPTWTLNSWVEFEIKDKGIRYLHRQERPV